MVAYIEFIFIRYYLLVLLACWSFSQPTGKPDILGNVLGLVGLPKAKTIVPTPKNDQDNYFSSTSSTNIVVSTTDVWDKLAEAAIQQGPTSPANDTGGSSFFSRWFGGMHTMIDISIFQSKL